MLFRSEKEYGKIILPQGNYEAFRIIIGKGEGKNWWCVMFPPLCFTDVTKGEIGKNKTMEELDEKLEDDGTDEKIEVKFKIKELLNKYFK